MREKKVKKWHGEKRHSKRKSKPWRKGALKFEFLFGLNSPSNIRKQLKCFRKYNILVDQKTRGKYKEL